MGDRYCPWKFDFTIRDYNQAWLTPLQIYAFKIVTMFSNCYPISLASLPINV